MKTFYTNALTVTLLISAISLSCGNKTQQEEPQQTTSPIIGTWRLLSGTLIEKGDTIVTDYTKNLSFIKIINDTHFAFLKHDLTKGKGPLAAYDSGGGTYSLKDSLYTEHLEYCTEREWEDNTFRFTVTLQNDTLVQRGVEKVAEAGIDRLNIERYVRVTQ
ncbi:hypothetical protein HNV11_16180 [Spirosoma taeanense]|uniref:Lipocalin-like domain-containing protein n=1 Tax=Spirosoma taeanense TaxID=2735870 RepID=A0A6M5YC00_9BACT|nr:hypothetical protein [Spirosoma taeanense]QJW90803.1 hypothetical protein HNV11_16180 [Spirosoma taeanense]